MDCLIALGSNLGEREQTLASALAWLRQRYAVRLVATSSFHPTRPMGGPAGQGEFLNAVARIDTGLSPRELLHVLLEVELQFGRERQVPWGPRTLDLDLLLYGNQIVNEPGLTIPHPRMHERAFVLAPACEIAADMRHPVLDKTLAELAQLLGDRA